MARNDTGLPTSIDPELQASIVRLLRVRGELGSLLVSDIISPVIQVGSTVPLEVAIRQPAFLPANWFTEGVQATPGANTDLADTLALPAGTYDLIVHIDAVITAADETIDIQHRNAANNATLAEIFMMGPKPGPSSELHLVFAQEFAENERLRVRTGGAFGAGEDANAWIFARIR